MKILGLCVCLFAGLVLVATGYEILFESFDPDDLFYLIFNSGLMAFGIYVIRNEIRQEKK